MCKFTLMVVAISSAVFFTHNICAQNRANTGTPLNYGTEYLSPVEDSRNIDTYIAEVFYPFAHLSKINLSFSAVASMLYATGDITRLEGEYSEGTLHDVNYKNSAIGLGPGVLAQWKYSIDETLSIGFEGTVNFIVYSDKFPAGGKHYNFMWRSGPSISYDFGNSSQIDFGYHWAHISNGTGMSPQNPSYDAKGMFIRFSSPF